VKPHLVLLLAGIALSSAITSSGADCSPNCELPAVTPPVMGAQIPGPSNRCYITVEPPRGCILPGTYDVGSDCWCRDSNNKTFAGTIY
jgi:hypothetical protein